MSNFDVHIRDFRCIKDIKLSFKPGLNVLRGTSNSGKSSVFAAIKSCIYNIPGSKNVRAGQDNYVVAIKYNEHEVMYRKGKSGNTYVVDNEQYTKTGVVQLPAVAQALNIQDIVMADEKIKINFWNQMEYPFLLDKSPSQLYRFVSDSGEDEALSVALKNMVKDRQATSVQLTLLEGKLQAEKDRVVDLSKKVSDSINDYDIYCKIINLEPEYMNVVNLKDLLSQAKEKAKIGREKQIRLSQIPDISQQDLEEIERMCKEKQELVEFRDSCIQSVKKLNYCKQKLDNLTAFDVEDVNVQEVIDLKNLYSQYSIKLESLQQNQNKLLNIDTTLQTLEEELSKISVCPTCGQIIGGHTHG